MQTECEEIQAFLDSGMSDDLNEIIELGNQTQVYISRTGFMLAEAKKQLNDAKKSDLINLLKDQAKEYGATAKLVNALVDSICSEQRYLVDWIDRLNAACTHRADWCRTLISKAKAEMQYDIYVKKDK